MTDAISRQQAIRWVKTECNPYGKPTLDFESGKKVIEHLEQMPPIHPEPHWIPVTERLPEKDGTYLVTADDFPVSTKFYSADSYGWGEGWRRVITAWMPLPEAYKPSGIEECLGEKCHE